MWYLNFYMLVWKESGDGRKEEGGREGGREGDGGL